MSRHEHSDDMLMGKRDDTVREPASVDDVVRKARALGFSESEIERLLRYFPLDSGEPLGGVPGDRPGA